MKIDSTLQLPGVPRGGVGAAAAVAFFLVFSLVVFIVFRHPPALSDQLLYFKAAADMPEVVPNHQHLRIGLVWPVSILQEVFGYSEAAYYMVPWATAFLLGISTWWLGSLMFSRRVGWVAGIFIVLIPGYVYEMSYLLPDYTATALLTLSIGVVYWAGKRTSSGINVPWPTLVLAGLLTGWAYLTREYVVILFPGIALALLFLHIPLSGWILFWGGALICYVVEVLWGWGMYGDPLIRISATASPRETTLPFSMDVVEILTQLPSLFQRLPGGSLVAAFFVFGLVSVAVGLFSKRTEWRILAIWGLLAWIFFTGVALLPLFLENNGVLLRMQKFRYWAIIFPPIIIGGVAAIFHLQSSAHRKSALAGVLVATTLLAVPAAGIAMGLDRVSDSRFLVRSGNRDYFQFRKFLRRSESLPKVFWMDRGSLGSDVSLSIFFKNWSGTEHYWSGQVKYLNPSANEWVNVDEIDHGYVVLDRTRAKDFFNNATPEYFISPKQTWRVVFESRDGRVLVLDPAGRTGRAD